MTSHPSAQMPAPPMIPCHCCQGKGVLPLSPSYHATLRRLQTFSKPVTVHALCTARQKRDSINTHLARLEGAGLICRVTPLKKRGRSIFWKAVAQA